MNHETHMRASAPRFAIMAWNPHARREASRSHSQCATVADSCRARASALALALANIWPLECSMQAPNLHNILMDLLKAGVMHP
jgi:hypothetical protein